MTINLQAELMNFMQEICVFSNLLLSMFILAVELVACY
jgi:hypothetical protein